MAGVVGLGWSRGGAGLVDFDFYGSLTPLSWLEEGQRSLLVAGTLDG